MAEKKSSSASFRMDVPTGVRTALWGVGIFVIFVVVVLALELYGMLSLVLYVPIIVGMLYAREIYKLIQPTYLEAAAGGAVSGAIYVVIIFVVSTILGSLLLDSLSSSLGNLSSLMSLGLGFGGSLAMDAILNYLLRAAILGALGGAWIVLLRTQQVK